MSGSFNERGEIDPSSGLIMLFTGRKGSGKSIGAGVVAMSWPYDGVVIDVAGDDGPMPRKPGTGTHDVIDLRGPVDELPRSWAQLEVQRHNKRPMFVRYVPDPGSPTELEDIDAVVGLALAHSGNPRPCLLLIHEIGRVAPAGRTPAHMRRVLNHNRHHQLTVICCGPRPKTIDPLVVQQADLVYVFELNSVGDRTRIAENIGWNNAEFDQAVHDLGRHEYLRFDAREPKPEEEGDEDMRLIHMPAFPEDVVDAVKAWVAGDQPTAA